MTKVRAELNYLRIAPRKVRLVSDLIRGLPVKDAEAELRFLPKRSSLPLLKLLKSAIANAEHNFNLEKRGLIISEIRVDQGPVLKRFRARAFGRAAQILKKTSHVTLVLESREAPVKKKTTQAIKVTKEAKVSRDTKDTEVSSGAGEQIEAGRVEKQYSIREAVKKERGGFQQRTKGFVKRVFQRKAI